VNTHKERRACIVAFVVGCAIILPLKLGVSFIFSTIIAFEYGSMTHWYLEITLLVVGVAAFIVGLSPIRRCFIDPTIGRALECSLTGFGAAMILLQGASLLFVKAFS
jgi:hypothetical protein